AVPRVDPDAVLHATHSRVPGARLAITRVADAVAVRVGLIGILHVRTVVDVVRNAVAVLVRARGHDRTSLTARDAGRAVRVARARPVNLLARAAPRGGARNGARRALARGAGCTVGARRARATELEALTRRNEDRPAATGVAAAKRILSAGRIDAGERRSGN